VHKYLNASAREQRKYDGDDEGGGDDGGRGQGVTRRWPPLRQWGLAMEVSSTTAMASSSPSGGRGWMCCGVIEEVWLVRGGSAIQRHVEEKAGATLSYGDDDGGATLRQRQWPGTLAWG
jgi:hypothetical protein